MKNYVQQSSQPSWFNENDGHVYVCATLGLSPFNEWVEFENEKEGHTWLGQFHQNGQSSVDSFEFVNGYFYDSDEIHAAVEASGLDYDEALLEEHITDGLEPVCLSDVLWAQSYF